ncbi:nucleotide-binding universal stress UspA family protein [Gillisia sp. Hel_I_86]|uniref:universal stress protein n=1 Tax=Gillisia sp. Hel_I_86 TaxID=1249981 RepID=UPI00119A222A|nr:universal stress protein [Gillisia sp. Hel_I_86]TVZ27563.1 nucleotide-binding universal stress UspA family protein [Gillisia sp. Hel_I_86]
MKNILIPTDFSENSWNAIIYAFSFFQKEEVTFHLIHFTLPSDNSHGEHSFENETSLNESNSKMESPNFKKLLDKINQFFPENRSQILTVIRSAKVIEGIRLYLINEDIDLLIMGTKGASNYHEFPIGNQTLEVITKVKCSILVIPEKAIFKIPISLVFPTDFNIVYKSKIINSLIDIVNIQNASIKILRVAQNQKKLNDYQVENRDYLKKNLDNVPYSFHVIDNPNLERGLQFFINTMKVDMVAMVAKNINFSQRLLFKPSVTQFNYHREIPFLVLHE